MANMNHCVGIRSMLQDEMDVALELYMLCTDHYWIEWNIEKVQSHIEEEATPDKFSWYCNDYVDQLATKA